MTNNERIENYLRNHKKGISSMEAFKLFNITRLSAVIYELKHRYGLKIDMEWEKNKNTGKRYGVYKLYD